MGIITNEKAHIFLTNPSLLDSKDVELIENKIKNDPAFKEFIEELRQYQDELQAPNAGIVKEMAASIEERLKRPNKILRLTALQASDDEIKNTFRMAASSQSDTIDEEKFVNTYASAEKFVLLRVFKNSFRGEYALYLVADDMKIVQNALVNFENFAGDYVADKDGLVRIKADYIDEKIASIVRLPVSRFEIDVNELKNAGEYSAADLNFKLLMKHSEGELSISFDRIGAISSKRLKLIAVFDNDAVNAAVIELGDTLNASLSLPEYPFNALSVALIDNS